MKERKIAKNGTTNRLTESLNHVLADSYALMIARITLHQKTIWMLRSFLHPS